MPSKILLVDDDTIFRSELKEALGEYTIVEAPNGEEALKLLKKPNDIDLVILDVKMPGVSGTEVLRQIKDISPKLGIIILTGFSSEAVAVEALRGHADDYIEKPVDIHKTKEIIERLLEARLGADGIAKSYLDNKIEKVKNFIQKNCRKKLSLADAAGIVSLSPKYLSRAFKVATGVGFNAYRLQFKVAEAKALLQETSCNVNEISEKLGYENTESFIRIFEKMTGQTPTEYRKKTRSNKSGEGAVA